MRIIKKHGFYPVLINLMLVAYFLIVFIVQISAITLAAGYWNVGNYQMPVPHPYLLNNSADSFYSPTNFTEFELQVF